MPYEFSKYSATAEAVYRVLFECTPWVAGLSCDEALLEVTQQCFAIANDRNTTNHDAHLPPPLQPHAPHSHLHLPPFSSMEMGESGQIGGGGGSGSGAAGQQMRRVLSAGEAAVVLAERLRKQVVRVSGGCTASVGSGPNRLLARVSWQVDVFRRKKAKDEQKEVGLRRQTGRVWQAD
jgi:nucleotidyltransferase/DNA polymerase involved in DNA repair